MRSVKKYVLVFEVMCMYRPKLRAIHFPLYDVSVEPETHLLYMVYIYIYGTWYMVYIYGTWCTWCVYIYKAIWWNKVEVRAGLA